MDLDLHFHPSVVLRSSSSHPSGNRLADFGQFRGDLGRDDSVRLSGEHSRLGCSSARSRAEHRGSHQRQTVRLLHAVRSAVRAQLIALGAGAIPISIEPARRANQAQVTSRET